MDAVEVDGVVEALRVALGENREPIANPAPKFRAVVECDRCLQRRDPEGRPDPLHVALRTVTSGGAAEIPFAALLENIVVENLTQRRAKSATVHKMGDTRPMPKPRSVNVRIDQGVPHISSPFKSRYAPPAVVPTPPLHAVTSLACPACTSERKFKLSAVLEDAIYETRRTSQFDVRVSI